MKLGRISTFYVEFDLCFLKLDVWNHVFISGLIFWLVSGIKVDY